MLEFHFKDLLDVLLVAILMYQTYRLLKGTTGSKVFVAVLAFIICWFFVSFVFHMELLGSIMNKVVSVGGILLIILFQDELRSFFIHLGNRRSNNWMSKVRHLFINKENDMGDLISQQLVLAVDALAKHKTGALIVIQNEADLTGYWQTGERIDARIRARLIENIFFKNTPLHDGAMIVVDEKIRAAACILPVSRNPELPKQLGLRHRAALGISEKTDASVIVVSEETGKISYVNGGQIHIDIKADEIPHFLQKN